MRVRVRHAGGEADLERVARMRYAVYVEESGINLVEADHERRVIREPLDDWGTVFLAEETPDGELLGTVRINHAWQGPLGAFVDDLGMKSFAPYFPRRCSLISRLMVGPAQRGGPVPWLLMRSAFAAQVEASVAFCFAECRPSRLAWTQRLGFRQVMPDYKHPTDGRHHALVLLLEDADHLARLGSPVRRLVRNAGGDSVRFFREQPFGHTMPNHRILEEVS